MVTSEEVGRRAAGRLRNELRYGAWCRKLRLPSASSTSIRETSLVRAHSLLLSPQVTELSISIALGQSSPIGLVVGTDEPFTECDSSTILRE